MQSGQDLGLSVDLNQLNSLLASQLEHLSSESTNSKPTHSLEVKLSPTPTLETEGDKLTEADKSSPFTWHKGNLHFEPNDTVQKIATEIYQGAHKVQNSMAKNLYADAQCKYTVAACCFAIIGIISTSGEVRIGVAFSGNNQTTKKAATLLKIFTAAIEVYNSKIENNNRQAKLLTSPLCESFMRQILKYDDEIDNERMCAETVALAYVYQLIEQNKLDQVMGMACGGFPIWVEEAEVTSSKYTITGEELWKYCKQTLHRLEQPFNNSERLDGPDLIIAKKLTEKYALNTTPRHWHNSLIDWFHCENCNIMKPYIRDVFEKLLTKMTKPTDSLAPNLSPVKDHNGSNMLHLKFELMAELTEDMKTLTNQKNDLVANGLVSEKDDDEACYNKAMALVKGALRTSKKVTKDSEEKEDKKLSSDNKDNKDNKDNNTIVGDHTKRSLCTRFIAVYQSVIHTRAKLDAVKTVDPYADDVYNQVSDALCKVPCNDNKNSASSSSCSSSSSVSSVSKEQKTKQIPLSNRQKKLLPLFNKSASSSSSSSSSCSSTSNKEQKAKNTKRVTQNNTSHSASSSSSSSTRTSPAKKVQQMANEARKHKKHNSSSTNISKEKSESSSVSIEVGSTSSDVSISDTSIFSSLTLFSPLPLASASTGMSCTSIVTSSEEIGLKLNF